MTKKQLLKDKLAQKSRQHTVYKDSDGNRVPGVTTITGVLNKPQLVPWANRMGLQGIDTTKYVDELAGAGTCAHLMVEKHLKKEAPDLSAFSQDQIDLAENAFLKYLNWEKTNTFEVVSSEIQLVSDRYHYGGTLDIYGHLNGTRTLIDLKTSKGIYSEHFTQVSAYRNLLIESGVEVEDCRILRIGRDESEGFDDVHIPRVEIHFELFKSCLKVYELQKILRRKETK